jgi:hypothetical protein
MQLELTQVIGFKAQSLYFSGFCQETFLELAVILSELR